MFDFDCSVLKDFIGSGWKMTLIVSYADFFSDDSFDFEPTFVIQKVCVNCTLVTMPRPVPVTARRFRAPPQPYSVSHHGEKTQLHKGGIDGMHPGKDGLKAMHPGGIYIDPNWLGPFSAGSNSEPGAPTKMYTNNIYVPIPVSLFAATDTRLFDVDVRLWVSVASNSPVEVRASKRLSFTQFFRMNADGSMGCALMA